MTSNTRPSSGVGAGSPLRSSNYNQAAAQAFLNRLDRSGVDMELRVDSGPEVFRIADRRPDGSVAVHEMTRTGPGRVDAAVLRNVRLIARYVFAGKGSPEHCQIVLQLADHWGLAPSGLQSYADNALGLDCNGFVGNYLWHIKRGRPWSDLELDANEGPDSVISQYFVGKTRIGHWQDMKPGRSYIFGKVNDTGAIIEGGGSAANAGHIAITEPSRFRGSTFLSPPAVYVVEFDGRAQPGPLGELVQPTEHAPQFSARFQHLPRSDDRRPPTLSIQDRRGLTRPGRTG